jgi:hypothetical protein
MPVGSRLPLKSDEGLETYRGSTEETTRGYSHIGRRLTRPATTWR